MVKGDSNCNDVPDPASRSIEGGTEEGDLVTRRTDALISSKLKLLILNPFLNKFIVSAFNFTAGT